MPLGSRGLAGKIVVAFDLGSSAILAVPSLGCGGIVSTTTANDAGVGSAGHVDGSPSTGSGSGASSSGATASSSTGSSEGAAGGSSGGLLGSSSGSSGGV